MKFLCLAGAGTNAETFRMQILPIVNDLEEDGIATFHFINGELPSPPPKGLEEFFGAPPHLRFLDDHINGVSDQQFREAIWKTPRYLSPEQKLRHLARSLRSEYKGTDAIRECFDRLYRILDEEGPFDGIMGHSEGAIVAATFVVEHLRRVSEGTVPDMLKCAVFMSGGAPLTADGKGIYLADNYGTLITMPTCHILGYNDTMIDTAIALYHLCDEESATIVDHGKGHMIPHDAKSSRYMINGIRELIARAETTPMV